KRLTKQGRRPATVNRYLANLHMSYVLGKRHGLVIVMPEFPWRSEMGNERQGFLTREKYEALRAELAPHAKLVLVIGYYLGLRRGEILGLKWDQVDMREKVIRLKALQTKNKSPRIAPIYGELYGWLDMARTERDQKFPGCPWVIQVRGKRIYSLRTAWLAALRRMNTTEDLLIHDLRRTALSNMEDAGIPRSVAMSISGHKTESAYKRYLIGNQKRVIEAGHTMEVFHEKQREAAENEIGRA